MKKFIKGLAVITALTVAVGLTGCGAKEEAKGKDDNKIVLGVSPTPHEEIIKHLEPQFKEAGLTVEVKAFDDYILPNEALNDGDLDANYFQHKPYLEQFCADHNMELVSLGGVHVEPMGLYSKKVKSIDDIADGAEILIPNDPTNGARALLLLEKNGLIKMKDPKNLAATEKDIVENKKNLKFTAVDAATIPKAYEEVDAGVINSNFALGAGIDPKTALVQEDKDSPWTNIVAVKKENKDLPKFKKLMEVLHSDEAKAFIEKQYKGEVLPAFTTE